MAALIYRGVNSEVVIPTEEIIAHSHLENDPFERLYVALERIFLRSTMRSIVRDYAQGPLLHAFSGLQQQYQAHPVQEGAIFSFKYTYDIDISEDLVETVQVISHIVQGLIVATPAITRLERHFLTFTQNPRVIVVDGKNFQEKNLRLDFEMTVIPNA